MPFTVDPIRKYENVNGVCIVQTAKATLAVGNNQLLVSATSGYRIRVMGWLMQSDGGIASTVTFKSNSGGSTITTPITLPVSTAGANEKLPIVDCGYMETSVGHGLYVDVITAGALINVFYINYIP